MERKKVLISGDLGVVGFAAAKHFSRLPEWDVVGISRRTPLRSHGAEHLSVDLTSQEACIEVFSQMSDVTHVVYAALYEKPGLIRGWRERDQMETNRAMLENLFEPLRTAARDLPLAGWPGLRGRTLRRLLFLDLLLRPLRLFVAGFLRVLFSGAL
jgi:nucleoside-diphosphate-sugar epimerase